MIHHNYDYGIRLDNSNNNTITNNTIRDNIYGIELWNSNNSTIINNTIQNGYNGIRLDGSNNNAIMSNKVQNSLYGIYLNNSNNNTITNNTFVSDGLFVELSYDNVVVDNTVNGKPLVYLEDAEGVVIDYPAGQVILVNCRGILVKNQNISNTNIGIELWNSNGSVIVNNTIHYNYDGIYLNNSHHNTITNNTIHHNYDYGIELWNSNNSAIINNTIQNNDGNGIRLDGSHHNIIANNMIQNNLCGIYLNNSHHNTISNDTIQNGYNGIRLDDSDNNTIANNTVHHNHYGIELDSSDNNLVYLNNFINNTNQYYVNGGSGNRFYSPKPVTYTYHGETYLNYTGNYWSDYTGDDVNSDGIGDAPYGPDQYPLIARIAIINGKIIIKGTAPQVTIIQPQNNTATNNSTITVIWHAKDLENDTDHYEIYVNGSPVNTSIPESQTRYVLELSEGEHKITVKAIDKAGNIGEDTVRIIIDLTAPTVTITAPGNGTVLSKMEVRVTWVGSDALSGISHYELYVDGSPVGTSISPDQAEYTVILSEGAHTIVVKAVDNAGNTGVCRIIVSVKLTSTLTFSDYIIVLIMIASIAVAATVFWKRKK